MCYTAGCWVGETEEDLKKTGESVEGMGRGMIGAAVGHVGV